MEHKIALVDVHCSNSLIEAHNRIIKYNYLYRMDILNGLHLRKVFAAVIHDFNSRPHASLKGLTPNEAEQNFRLDQDRLRRYIVKVTKERKRTTRTTTAGNAGIESR